MLLYTLHHMYRYELENLCRLFCPKASVQVISSGAAQRNCRGAKVLVVSSFAVVTDIRNGALSAQLYAGRRRLTLMRPCGAADELTLAKLLFVLLRRHTGCLPPWGLLTGVRPSKLMLRLRRDQGAANAAQYFQHTLWVSFEKTALAAAVARAEEPVLALTTPRSFSLYVSVPFCPSRCAYCSFVSHTVERASAQKRIPAYVDRLCEEIEYTGRQAQALGLQLESIYIGGGTPTILSAPQLRQVCAAIRNHFTVKAQEFTVEAGRPDTITEEKLRVLLAHGVNRLSVNPQTMRDEVLARAGRRHTARDCLESYALARRLGFDNINMDLIAGLPGDSPAGFCASLEQLIALRPENITVHTLAFKRAAQFSQQAQAGAAGIVEMLQTAQTLLAAAAYAPYYMYRQSRSLGNLENIGWSLPGRYCRYNIDMMEESHTILACGAGGVTKCKQVGTDYLERIFSLKYPYEYLSRFDELMQRKQRMAEFYRTYNNNAQ